MSITKTFFTMAVGLAALTAVNAQEQSKEDTLQKKLDNILSDIKVMKRLKLSGYIQANLQFTDSAGTATYAGGNFNANTDKRFAIRRTRFKATYENGLSQFVLQLDANEREVRTKDAYVKFTEPWAKAFSATIGITDFPFGYEVPTSSSSLESPERGRMSQILMPGESDLGAYITFQLPKTSRLNFLKIDAGMFNGTGGKAGDFDYKKDFVGRIRIDKVSKSEKFKYGFGVSYYDGGWRQGTSKVYSMETDSAATMAFLLDKDTANYGAIAKRNYMGADVQLSYDFPFGLTTLRGEFIQGSQPGSSSSATSVTAQPVTDNYDRNFNGAYFYFIQDIFQTKNQLIVKYDWFDPNTDVEGDDIGKSVLPFKGTSYTKTGRADFKYTTLGIGWAYRWNSNLKITAYYDMVTNETSKNVALMSKDLSDNVFTLRFQYKF